MHAIVECGGKQYRVAAGDIFQVELLAAEEGQEHIIDKVIAISSDEGTMIGNPYLAGARVVCKVLDHGKGRKVIVFHYKPKKNIRKKKGHRQPFTKLEVIRIEETAAGEEIKEIISAEEFSEEIAVLIPNEETSEEIAEATPAEETATDEE
jgi:large subunit ribosomal protein L21